MMQASVIIPVRQGSEELPTCLDALMAQSQPAAEIIAVDNASTDGSGDLIAQGYPQVQLLRNPTNIGFGEACNQGMAQARGDVLVLLNQDTQVEPDWLANLLAPLEADPQIGIAGSKAHYPNGRIQHAGGQVDAQGGGSHIGLGETDTGQFDQMQDVDYVTGASLALRRAVWEATGGFDPGFSPAYSEDVDLCLHARRLGWRVVYIPDSVLIHHERSRAATPDHAGMLLQHRNRLRVVAKHWPRSRLNDEFLPAETAWLEALGPGGERLISAVHHAYLAQLLALHDLAAWRERLLDEPATTIDVLVRVMLELRAIYPLGLIGEARSTDATTALPALQDLEPLARIREQPIRPNIPILGRWIGALCRQWSRFALAWYVQPMLHQQSRFNLAVMGALHQTQDARASDQHIQTRQASVLAAYIAGQAREISTLSQEVTELQQALARLSAAAEGPAASHPEPDAAQQSAAGSAENSTQKRMG